MRISAIVATARNGAIGIRGNLPWNLPEDLKRFKALTWGNPIIMGRKTYESIGRVLPGRMNIIITRQDEYSVPGAEIVKSFEEALARCPKDAKEVFVIGGSEVYALAMPRVDRIYLTWIGKDFEADAFFPPIPKDFKETQSENHRKEEAFDYSFKILDRI
ncbi:MAG: dihydrofolate reductase [Bdellovibrio sp.]|nr:dihydrofolate reductase [Bdellovibrio sp.]